MEMEKKIIGIFIGILFLTTGIVSAINTSETDIDKHIEEILGKKIFVIGRMEKINYTGTALDFEVVSFVFIKDGKDIQKLTNGEKIRFFAPMTAVLFRKMVIGRFADWSLIE